VPKVKVSQQSLKINIPGLHNVRRYFSKGKAVADMIYLEGQTINPKGIMIIDPNDATQRKRLMPAFYEEEELLTSIFMKGKLVYALPSLQQIRERAAAQLEAFDKTHKRLTNPHVYPVGLEEQLHQLRMELVISAKNSEDESNHD
jgi:nicotinate phosphoribosyltransferase